MFFICSFFPEEFVARITPGVDAFVKYAATALAALAVVGII